MLPGGNATRSARSDPHREFAGKNVLYEAQPLERTASAAGLDLAAAEAALAAAREALFGVRAARPRPHRDEKVVAAWNGMAIGALAVAGRALRAESPPSSRLFPVEGRPPAAYLAAAAAAAAFVRARLYDAPSRRLRRAFTRGPSAVFAFSDDYAWMVSGLLDLYASTGDVAHLRWARDLQSTLDGAFWDGEGGGGYFQGVAGDDSIKLRLKEDYDGAEPAASSIAAANLWRLAGLAGAGEAAGLRARAQACAAAFSGRLGEAALALPQMCASLHLLTLGQARQVVVAGRRGAADTEALLDAAFSVYAPDKIIIHLDLEDDEVMGYWREHNPEAVAVVEATGMGPGDPATAFICQK